MTREALEALAVRCEQALAEQQAELLNAAFKAVHGAKPTRSVIAAAAYSIWREPFDAMLDANAFVDAALTLVPEGWRFYVDNGTLDGGNCHGCVFAPGDGWNPPRAQGGCRNAATPALAITAAALRAHAAKEGK